jgi:hypothetical protein
MSFFNQAKFIMANAVDFISTVYDTLAKLLSIEGASESTFMQMAWPGYSFSPADFKPPTDPNGSYDPDIAQEVFSNIANIAPTFNRTKFENSGYQVDDIYDILIASAIPIDATEDSLAVNPLNRLFSDAQFELLQARRGSKIEPNVFYYPCKATPTNWYDEAAAQFWPTIDIKSTDIKPFDNSTSPFAKTGGQTLVKQGVWRLKSAKIDATMLRSSLQQVKQRLQVTDTILGNMVPAVATVANTGSAVPARFLLANKPLNANMAAAIKNTSVKPANVTLIRTPEFATNLSLARNNTIFTTKNVPVNTLIGSAVENSLATLTVDPDTLNVAGISSLLVDNRILIQDLIYQQLPIKPVSEETSGFSISFKFCRINIDRNWLKLALLNTRSWYMSNTAAGEYSTGKSEANPGIFPLLPVSLVAICDLKITANWSPEDRANLNSAISFGPFNIQNRTLNQNTLEVKGLQIIAWISRLTPSLPPIAK